MGNYPALYNPDPELFIERGFNEEGFHASFFSGGKSLAYLNHGFITKQFFVQGKQEPFPCKNTLRNYQPFVYYNYTKGCQLLNQDITGIIVYPLIKIHPGSIIDFNSDIFNSSMGWSNPESFFRWSDGESSFLLFDIDSKESISSLNAITIKGTTYGSILVAIEINGYTIFNGTLAINNEDKKLTIPSNILSHGANSLVFKWKNPAFPTGDDYRHVSFALSKITF